MSGKKKRTIALIVVLVAVIATAVGFTIAVAEKNVLKAYPRHRPAMRMSIMLMQLVTMMQMRPMMTELT
jgi:flagellar basal body-associated protein FliL